MSSKGVAGASFVCQERAIVVKKKNTCFFGTVMPINDQTNKR